jgi:prepilin-type N-terminal cleavage/methylation domain-containing protein
MKTNNFRSPQGFTLIEMVGVLAVIAILAALLVPKIFAAINDSRFSNSVASINSVKTATMDYFGKKGNFGAAGVAAAFDTELVKENCLERPLACKVAETSSTAEVVSVGALAIGALTGGGANYALDGATVITGDKVVQIKLVGVSGTDAQELSKRIDGETVLLTPADATAADTMGRVTHAAIAAGATGTVYIYLAHK